MECQLRIRSASNAAAKNANAALLMALFAANVLFHLESMNLADGVAEKGLYLALYTFAAFLSLISGRVIPNFTVSALRMQGEDVELKIIMPLELGAFVAIVATAIADLSMGGGPVSSAGKK